MSASLARSRSLRKPSGPPSADDPSAKRDADRHGSPSRLPVKPHARTPSTTTNTTTTSSATRPARPLSGAVTRSASTRQPSDPTKRNATTATRYPPSTTMNRTASLSRPTSSGSGQPTQTTTTARRVPAHTRTRSAANATTSSSSTIRPSTVLRPPSQGTNTTVRPAATTTTHQRKPSADHAVAQSRTQKQQQQQQQQPRPRPAFSAPPPPQHPAKPRDPKPPPTSPSKLPANVAAEAEAGRQQAELLQLHLVHAGAAGVEARWRGSARERLGRRFAALGSASAEVAARERAGAERANVAALRGWPAAGCEDGVQALDAVASGLWTLSEPGGRYARLARRFERWLGQVHDVEEARREGAYLDGLLGRDDGGDGGDGLGRPGLFVSDLETPWREDLPAVARRLDAWSARLAELGDPPAGADQASSVARIVAGSRAMIDAMRAELGLMEDVEAEALAREARWMEDMSRDDEAEPSKAEAVWRAL